MSELKKLIQDRVVNPADHVRGSVTTAAKVLNANEKNNLCEIEYIDKEGIKRNKQNVSVRIYGDNSWFPSSGDYVIVEDQGSQVTVVSKFVGNYNQDVRQKSSLDKDIYSDKYGATSGGCIF